MSMPEISDAATELIFWERPYQKEFDARIIAKRKKGVILDRTAFYPEGGGQLSDTGVLINANGETIPVVSVEKEKDQIIHCIGSNELQKLAIGESVQGKIDWSRRYNLMLAHSSQHILSAIIKEIAGVETSKAAIEPSEVTIYLEKNIPLKKLKESFVRTNQLILANKEISTKQYGRNKIPQEIKKSLRGELTTKKERSVRVVSIEGIDYSLCGGTHCKTTAEIGLVVPTDFKGDKLHYLLAKKALPWLAALSLDTITTAKLLAAKPEELVERIPKLLDDLQDLKLTNTELSKMVLPYLLADMRKKKLVCKKGALLVGDFQFIERKFVLQEVRKNHFTKLSIC
jgi:alanyl-tRNA synthetase